jgi:hypothetical protein
VRAASVLVVGLAVVPAMAHDGQDRSVDPLRAGRGGDIQTGASARVVLSGWLHVVRNGELRVMLVADRGEGTRLLIDDATLHSLGGVARVDRRRVTIVGERVSEVPPVVRVLSVHVDRGAP